jgi:hypothetical protein
MGGKYYERLGVPPDASTDEIAAAYREQLKDTHPDVSDASDAGERTKRLIEAKEVLTDETERARYDRLGHERYISIEQGRTPDPAASSAGDNRESDSRTHSGTDSRGQRSGEESTDSTAAGGGTGRQRTDTRGTRGSGGVDWGTHTARRGQGKHSDGIDWEEWAETDWEEVSEAVWQEVTGEHGGGSRHTTAGWGAGGANGDSAAGARTTGTPGWNGRAGPTRGGTDQTESTGESAADTADHRGRASSSTSSGRTAGSGAADADGESTDARAAGSGVGAGSKGGVGAGSKGGVGAGSKGGVGAGSKGGGVGAGAEESGTGAGSKTGGVGAKSKGSTAGAGAGGGGFDPGGVAGKGATQRGVDYSARTADRGDWSVGWYSGGDPSGTSQSDYSYGNSDTADDKWGTWSPGLDHDNRYSQASFPPHQILSPMQSVVLFCLCFVTYPLLVTGTVFEFFDLPTRLVLAMFLVFVVAILIILSQLGVVVFGGWTVMFPIVFANYGVSVFAPASLLTMTAVLGSLGFAMLSWLLIRPPAL